MISSINNSVNSLQPLNTSEINSVVLNMNNELSKTNTALNQILPSLITNYDVSLLKQTNAKNNNMPVQIPGNPFKVQDLSISYDNNMCSISCQNQIIAEFSQSNNSNICTLYNGKQQKNL